MVIRDEKEYKDYEAREFTMLSEALDEYGRA